MSISIEEASKLAVKEIQEMSVNELVAEIYSNENSQLSITMREIVDFSESCFSFNEIKTYYSTEKSLKYADLHENTYKQFSLPDNMKAANSEEFLATISF